MTREEMATMTKKDWAIYYHQRFKKFCEDNQLANDAPITKGNMKKACNVILRICNYKSYNNKPITKTIFKYVPSKFLEKLELADILYMRYDTIYVSKWKLKDFINHL